MPRIPVSRPSIPVNGATKRLSNTGYDANGNMISGAGVTLGYDEANRIVSATEYSGGTEYYAYTPDGKQTLSKAEALPRAMLSTANNLLF